MRQICQIFWLICTLAAVAARPAFAQDKAALRPVRIVMASAKLQVAARQPLYFRLLGVTVAPTRSATFDGPAGFVFVTGGKVELASGTDKSVLSGGDAKYLAADTKVTLSAKGSKPAMLLHYMLTPEAGLGVNFYSSATISDLHRGAAAIPLVIGPHEFSLARVTSPVGAPAPPMHHRSGAALYRVLSGTATIHFEGRDEPRATGAVQYEPRGFLHTWENTGKVPLVLLQANISAEGAPEIIWLK